MRRYLDDFLGSWAKQIQRKPILLRGARQTGKSYSVRELGKSFKSYVEINFERQPEYADLFKKDIDVSRIVRELSIITGKSIVPGETLLFLDEIQVCPIAVTALRYFYEEMADLHVIAAGSLLEFALEKISVPVGRINLVHVRPFTFFEFLEVGGRQQLVDMIRFANCSNPLTEVMHSLALQLFRDYCYIGGMPAALKKIVESNDYDGMLDEQQSIIATYRNDFHKYATRSNTERIEAVFSAVPKIAGKKVAYSKIDPDSRAFQVKNAIDLLEKAYVIARIRATSGAGVPLAAGASSSRFKLIMVDTGLFQRIAGIKQLEWWNRDSIVSGYLGTVIEQVVGQELLCIDDKDFGTGLYYWDRAEVRATAEVDYLFAQNGRVIPIEVKAGATGHLKSMYRFLADHAASPVGIRISERAFSKQDKILNVPVYAASCIPVVVSNQH
jgi:predicted AAA+ superfamily ATPase